MSNKNKQLTFEQIQKIKSKIDEIGYLRKEDISFFVSDFNFSKKTFFEELIRNRLRFYSKFLKVTILTFNIYDENKKEISLDELNPLGDWKINLFKNSKIKANFICKECETKNHMMLKNIVGRNFFKLEPICPKCINKKVRNLEEMIEKNKKNQKIAQNKPGVRERMSIIVKERFNDFEYRKKVSEASKKVWLREGYKDKMIQILRDRMQNEDHLNKLLFTKGKTGLTGYYKGIFYASSYELAFLMKEESEIGNLNHIKRSDIAIPYVDNKNRQRSYYPDFIKNSEIIVEVKGFSPWVDLQNLQIKNNSAKEFCKKKNMQFRLVTKEDLTYFWIRQAIVFHKNSLNSSGDGKDKV